MTLEQLMLRQEEERLRSNRARERISEAGGFISPEQFLSRQEEERQRYNRNNRSRGEKRLKKFYKIFKNFKLTFFFTFSLPIMLHGSRTHILI